MICSFYSHYTGFEKIIELTKKRYPKAQFRISEDEGSQIADIEIKGGIFSSSSRLRISYRQRYKLSYQLLEEDVCPLSMSLKGLYGFASSLPSNNEGVRELLLHKITTVNTEFAVSQEQGQTKDVAGLLRDIAHEFDAILFVQPDAVISRSQTQHLQDANLQLIIDHEGNCEVDTIAVRIESKYFEQDLPAITEDQVERRKRSETFCIKNNIPVYQNPGSLFVESETTVSLRTKDEVVDRAIALCFTEVKSEGPEKQMLNDFAARYNVMVKLSPAETRFALNDTPEQADIVNANWRAESFHLLLWSLGFIDELSYPSDVCNVGEDVKHLFGRSEDEFRNAAVLRSKEEILDQADLILRLSWACVDARMKQQPPPAGLNGSVVYERHYALNWLISFYDQDWDHITTNT
jgi:hypothetical protein